MNEFIPAVGLYDWLFLMARWMHIISAVIWVGGSAFMSLILVPVWRQNANTKDAFIAVGVRYRQLIHAIIILLVISGILLMLERIYVSSVPPAWFIFLGVKILISLIMFYIIWRGHSLQSKTISNVWLNRASHLLGYNALLPLGVVALLCASFMQRLFELSNGI